jgi:uncharacterized protein YkwD
LDFNLVDWLLLAVFAFALLDGMRRGFAVYASELIAFAVSLTLAFAAFGPLGRGVHDLLMIPTGLAGFGAFLALLVVGHGLVLGALQWSAGSLRSLVARRLERAPTNGVVRAAGAFPALGTAVVLAALALSALVAMPQAGGRSLILSSTLGSTITRSASFMQQPLHALLVPAAKDSQNTLGPPRPVQQSGEPFYQMSFPRDIQVELDVQAENRMLQLLNQARAAHGLPALSADPDLQSAARDHSQDMYRRAYFSHVTPDRRTPFDRIRAAGVVYVTAGENIAYAPDVDDAETGLLDSPEHRANILNADFKRVGIGVYRGLDGYEEMFTQDFADYA